MLNMTVKALTLGLFSTLALSLTACNGSVDSVLKDANLAVSTIDGSNYVSMRTEINTDKLAIAAASLQIANGLGQIDILNDISTGKSYVQIGFRLGKALALPSFAYTSTLPNGTTIPLTGISLNRMMAFNVGTGGSKLYLYYDATAKKAILGLALNVAQLSTGTAGAILGSFTLGNVTGVAGLYTGAKTNGSGLAVFVDLSSVFAAVSSDVLADNVYDVETMSRRTPIGFVEVRATDAQLKMLEQRYQQQVRSGKVIRIR